VADGAVTDPLRWQILIAHMPHRHAKFVSLLDVLAPQMRPGVEVLVYADNLQASYRDKLQALADAAQAEWTSHLSNDDSVAPDFVPRVLEAMEQGADYIGFRVRYTEAGVPQMPVIHSLACGEWKDTPGQYFRDLMYFNPIRRELATQVKFRGAGCDAEWGEDLRALGIVKNETFIDAEMLYYQRDPSDNFHTPRVPLTEDQIPPLPQRPWLRYLPLGQVT
jgi:hypothetical protein